MKLQGILGKGTGKLGNAVFAVSGGEQIMREYNPNVSNPNTDAQVAQRAKLKLMSQLASALSLAIGFKKQGLVSARNQFISKNIGSCSYENDTANVDLLGLDLTGSSRALPDIQINSGESVQLESSADGSIKSVFYAHIKPGEDGKIEVVKTALVTEAGPNRQFVANISVSDVNDIVFAFGLTDTTSGKSVTYGDYEVESSTNSGSLGVVQKLIASGAIPTRTRSAQL